MRNFFLRSGIVAALLVLFNAAAWGQFYVSSISPANHALDVSKSTNITLTFNDYVNASNVNSNASYPNVIVTGSMSGRHSLTKESFTFPTLTVTLNPDDDFLPGEVVTVTVMYDIYNGANTTTLGVSKQYSFTVASEGTGIGYFTSSDSFNGSTTAQPEKIYGVDYDQDGDVDVISMKTNSYIYYTRKENASDTYTNPSSAIDMTGVGNLKSLAFSDMNRDGYIDIIGILSPGGSNITTARVGYNYFGSFNSPYETTAQYPNGTFNTTYNAGSTVADVNVDGYDDFIVRNTQVYGVVPFYSSSGSSFSQGSAIQTTATGDILTADFNSDGYPDFVGVSGPSDAVDQDTIGILLTTAAGAYSAVTKYRTETGASILSTAIGDVDGDGDLDIIVGSNTYSNNLTVFWNNGTGGFSSKSTSSLANRAIGLKAADMDGDGDLDLVYYSSTYLYVSFNNGSGTFNSHASYSLASGMTTFTDLAVFDADGDGDLDAVLNDPNNMLVRVYKNSVVTAPSSAGGTPIFNYNYGDSITISLANGTGAKRLIVLKQGSAVDATPSDNTTYTANSTFGSGSDLGGGNYVVYNGSDYSYTNIPVSGLSYGTTYHIAVFEYNGPAGLEKYLTTGNKTGSGTTNTVPSSATVNAFTSNYGSTVTVNWSNGGGKGRIVVMKQGSAVSATPVNNTTYSANTVFGSGADLGGGNFVVYKGTGSSVTVTGLSLSTTYHVAVYEYFGGTGTEVYGSTESEGSFPGIGNVTTSSVDGIQFDGVPGKAFSYDGSSYSYSNNSIEIPDGFTFETWVKPALVNQQMVMLVLGSSEQLWLAIGADGKFFGHIYDEDLEDFVTAQGTTVANAGQWYHLALTGQSGANLKLYVNGVLEGESSGTIGTVSTYQGTLYPGTDYAENYYYEGLLDELRIWNSVRTASEIRSNMHKPLTGSNPTLLHYWQFNTDMGDGDYEDLVGNNTMWIDYASEVTSDVPFGSGTSSSVTAFQNGTQTIGNASLTMSDGFDNPVDIYVSQVTGDPNAYPTNFNASVGGKYFIIDVFGDPGTFSANLTLTFGEGVITAGQEATPSVLKLYKRSTTSNGGWTEFGGATSAVSATGEVTWTGLTSFSQAIVVDQNDALPVELSSFSAEVNSKRVELLWKTATELNNYGFEIERKSVGHNQTIESDWMKVGFVEGNGTSNAPQSYSYVDKDAKGKVSYRLKQIDHDGQFKYSHTVEVEIGVVPMVFALEQNYPNPFNPSTTIGFTLEKSGMTTLKVYDIVGREVVTLVNDYLEAGVFHQHVFDAKRLASGVYFMRLQSNGKSQLKKMMLMK